MKLLRSLWKALPGLLILAVTCWGLVEAIRGTASYLSQLNSDLSVALVSAAATAIVTVLALTIGRTYEARAAIRQELREKKTPIYEEIVSTLYRVLMASTLNREQMPQEELVDFFARTTERLTIWGSDDLVKSYSNFKNNATPDPANPSSSLFILEALLLAIRKDLGHKNKGLGKGSLLRLFVNDIDDHL